MLRAMGATPTFAVFEASMHRCLADASFLDRFYARFLLAHPEIAAKFARVDLAKQARVLRASLYLVLRAAAGHEDGLTHLAEVGHTHGSRKLDIRASHYQTWLDTLIQVASEVDGSFDGHVEAAWRENLAPCIQAVLSSGH